MSTIPSDELVDPKTPSKIVMTDTISYNHGQLAQLGFHDKFVARWFGDILIETGGVYTFQTCSDDGSNLFVNGNHVIVHNDGLHGVICRQGSINLAPGLYPVEVSFFEQGGGAHINADYKGEDTGGAFAPIKCAQEAPCYLGLVRDGSTMPWRNMDRSHVDYENWQTGVGGNGGGYTKTAISPSSGLVTNAGSGTASLPGICRKPPCHYLYFRAVACPPENYKAPKGASPNTWPQIYKNLQNIDYCVEKFKRISNRLKCIKAFNPGNFLP
jgi:hypothetical protein